MAPHPLSNPDVAQGLALAVVESSTAPLLLLDGDLALIAASDSFCSAFGISAAGMAGQRLAALGDGEWNVPQFISLLKATATDQARVEGYEFNLCRLGRPDRRLVINAPAERVPDRPFDDRLGNGFGPVRLRDETMNHLEIEPRRIARNEIALGEFNCRHGTSLI